MYHPVCTLYDGSPASDGAVQAAFELARNDGAEVFILGLCEPGEPDARFMTPADRMASDMLALARLGMRLDLKVDGTVLEHPDAADIRRELEQRGACRLVAFTPDERVSIHAAELLRELTRSCPVPLSQVATGARS